jgi:hypothetical protein
MLYVPELVHETADAGDIRSPSQLDRSGTLGGPPR